MHPEIDDFVVLVKDLLPTYFENAKVLEVGSQDINGSVRKHFKNCEYLGIDLGPAPGVDLVADICTYTGKELSDVVISSEMLEHCKYWQLALEQMYKNLSPGGLMILTCAGPARHEHGTSKHTPQDSKFTLDHYKNISLEDFKSVLHPGLFKEYSLGLYRGNTDLYFYGIKN